MYIETIWLSTIDNAALGTIFNKTLDIIYRKIFIKTNFASITTENWF